jgi:hypothetical protein
VRAFLNLGASTHVLQAMDPDKNIDKNWKDASDMSNSV